MCSPYYPVEKVYPTLPLAHQIVAELKEMFTPKPGEK